MVKPIFESFEDLPAGIVNAWPEVFNGIQMNTIPIEYLEGVNLHFYDGREWYIDLESQLINSTPEFVNETLLDILNENRSDISKIDFKIKIHQLKLDITATTSTLL